MFIASVSVALAVAASPAPDPASLTDRLDRDVPPLLASNHVPSAAIAVIRGGRVIATRVYGEQAHGIPATRRTLYNIASMTKPMTAEILLRMASAGVIGLDEPISPTFTDPDVVGDPRTEALTVRLLLSHRGGFPNWRAETGGKLSYRFAPGAGVSYSGEGYLYALHFAEARTHQDFGALAGTWLFDPAGMTQTSYTQKAWFKGRIAVPADGDGKALEPEMTDKPLAADLVYTTIDDYSRFVVSVMARQKLSPAIAAERQAVQADRTAEVCANMPAGRCPDAIGFGLGWEVIKSSGRTYLMHTGKDPGVSTFGYLNPDGGSGVVVLTNGDNGLNTVLTILDDVVGSDGEDADFVRVLRAEAGQ